MSDPSAPLPKLVLGVKVPSDGELTCDALDDLAAGRYRCGRVWGITIEVAGVTIHQQGGADLVDDEIRDRGVDVFLCGIAGPICRRCPERRTFPVALGGARRMNAVVETTSSLRALVEAHRREIKSIVARHKGTSVALFGSVARGEEGPGSDLDFLVEFGRGASLFDLARVEMELEELLGRDVDVVSAGGLLPDDDDIRADAVRL